MEAAQAIIDREEAASGRRFDTAFRADVLKKLASKSLEQLAAIRTGLGGGVDPSFLGSNTEDFVYTPVTPCRIIDTRLTGGPISAGTYRNFYATGVNFSGQGGTSGDCGIPKGPAKAVVINFVALGTSSPGPGNLSVTPYPSGFPLSSIINWTAGVNIANGIPAAICNNYYYTCTYDISVAANNNTVQVVADVLGYFAPPFATSLDVQIVFPNTPTTYYSCCALCDCGAFQNCNTGYTITGGGCQLQNYSFEWYWANNGPAGANNGWNCQGTNTSNFPQNYRVMAMCARVPGR